MLKQADDGDMFLSLLAGAGFLHQEPIAAAATSHTVEFTSTLVHVFEVRYVTSNLVLTEGLDYVVNYATGVITFQMSGGLAEASEVIYMSTSYRSPNLILNAEFEESITNLWDGVAGGSIARSTTSPYLGTYKGLITRAAANDGAEYTTDFTVHSGLEYTVRVAALGTATETMAEQWGKSGPTWTAASPATSALAATWGIHTYTFTPDVSTLIGLRFIVTTSSANPFSIDYLYLGLSDPVVDPMDGYADPFLFNLVARRRADNAVVAKLRGCCAYTGGFGSGGVGEDPYGEDISGQFLALEYEGEIVTTA